MWTRRAEFMNSEKVFSKVTGKRRPASTVTRNKEPNLDLMAKAIYNLYIQTIGSNPPVK